MLSTATGFSFFVGAIEGRERKKKTENEHEAGKKKKNPSRKKKMLQQPRQLACASSFAGAIFSTLTLYYFLQRSLFLNYDNSNQ